MRKILLFFLGTAIVGFVIVAFSQNYIGNYLIVTQTRENLPERIPVKPENKNADQDLITPNLQKMNDVRFSLVKEYDSRESWNNTAFDIRSSPQENGMEILLTEERKTLSYYKKGVEKKIHFSEAIPSGLNTAFFSPNEVFFILYETGESYTDVLYFYSNKGDLIKKIKLNIYPVVKFSSDGDFVAVYNAFGSSFYIYNYKAELVYSSKNYQDLTRVENSPLGLVDVLPGGESFLLYADKLYLFSITTGEEIWHVDSANPFNSLILKEENSAVLDGTIWNGKEVVRNLQLLSLQDGTLLDQIENVDLAVFNSQNKILLIKDEKYFEYGVQ